MPVFQHLKAVYSPTELFKSDAAVLVFKPRIKCGALFIIGHILCYIMCTKSIIWPETKGLHESPLWQNMFSASCFVIRFPFVPDFFLIFFF